MPVAHSHCDITYSTFLSNYEWVEYVYSLVYTMFDKRYLIPLTTKLAKVADGYLL